MIRRHRAACAAEAGMRELHQLFDAASSTFTYVIVDRATRDAVIIDAVDRGFETYSELIARDNQRLVG